VKWDQIWWFMFGVLFCTFHEYKCSVGWHLIFSLFRDKPSLLCGVCNVTMVSWNSFKFYLDLTLHWAANGEVVLIKCLQNDFLLDQIFVFIWTNPCWTSSQSWWILCIWVFNNVIALLWTHDIEGGNWLLTWLFNMSDFVKVVMDNFS
jgi:hypothetical protein